LDRSIDPHRPRRIPTARYTSAAWQALEAEKLWPRVWQIACTVDCVRAPGDYWEYAIGDLSILIVRGNDGALRAFQNACPHRGNLLLEGQGRGLERIRCAYHHWCFDLKGRLAEISPEDVRAAGAANAAASRTTNGARGRAGRGSRFDLVPVQVDVWAGFVFVNPDPDASSLARWLEALPEELAWVGMERFSCDAFMTVPVACNWKVVVDAFIETYHLHAVHPQMLAIADDVHTPITLYDQHTKFVQPYGVSSPRRAEGVPPQELWEAFVGNLGHRMGIPFADAREPGPHPAIPPGRTMRDVLVERIRAHLATMGPIYAELDDHHVIDDFHYHLFPNAVINVFAGWFGLIRARPGATPDACWLDMWNFDLRPENRADAHPRPSEHALSAEEIRALGPVLLQDLDLMPRVQRGLRQPGLSHFQPTRSEARIVRMHEVLDRYLAPPPGLRLDEV
jgi:phenylpropionate dioxygenase-like ring-hydroxylating dioxygenase large terminal subunit